MNLIEQLGGYERAKSIANCKSGIVHPTQQLLDALLEYRREHNIFEVGNWAFPLIRIIDEIEGVGRFICAEKGELVVIREMKNKGAYCSHEHRLDNSFYMAFSEFRHATDEEIQAVRRLPKIKCWSCGKEMSHSERSENDGFCIHCNAEIEL